MQIISFDKLNENVVYKMSTILLSEPPFINAHTQTITLKWDLETIILRKIYPQKRFWMWYIVHEQKQILLYCILYTFTSTRILRNHIVQSAITSIIIVLSNKSHMCAETPRHSTIVCNTRGRKCPCGETGNSAHAFERKLVKGKLD